LLTKKKQFIMKKVTAVTLALCLSCTTMFAGTETIVIKTTVSGTRTSSQTSTTHNPDGTTKTQADCDSSEQTCYTSQTTITKETSMAVVGSPAIVTLYTDNEVAEVHTGSFVSESVTETETGTSYSITLRP
jgi:hypothetical protein